MAGILDGLMQQLGGGALQQVSSTLGTDEATAGTAVSAAIPVLVAALARNAATPAGATALAGALDRDHDGSALDNLTAMLSGPQAGMNEANGQKMLRHMLGGGQPHVVGALSAATGMDAGKAEKLLTMLAPLVLAYLGKAKRDHKLDAGGLGAMLGAERSGMGQQGGAMGTLLSMLDRDKDGSVADDLSGMMGRMLGRRV